MLKEWSKRCAAIGTGTEEVYLYTLLFADDQVITANDEDDASFMIRKLTEEYKKLGLKLNSNNTEYLRVRDIPRYFS